MIPKVLTIAGSDSGGGAGIQADLKTFAAHGVHGCSVVTAVTAQNTVGVTAVENISLDVIGKQIDAVFSDIKPTVVKIGMLANAEIISLVASKLREWKPTVVALDPVMVASSGAKLLEDAAIDTLKKELIPLATVLTPNVDEAAILVGHDIKTKDDLVSAGKEILALGCQAVLMKGGHLISDPMVDVLLTKNAVSEFSHSKLDVSGHGTGCTLSSAIAANLAKSVPLAQAADKAITYTHDALEQGYQVGKEHVVLKHVYD